MLKFQGTQQTTDILNEMRVELLNPHIVSVYYEPIEASCCKSV